ncbi:MAG: AAA family ATPase, partial [Alphaproteobacteria bacterium]
MSFPVEEVFRTEGIPEFTFVKPPNFNEILVDIRTVGKPVIIEGQSGTGKTTTVKKIIEEFLTGKPFKYLSARKSQDMQQILDISENKVKGHFIIDDFHRLNADIQEKIANLIKISAEQGQDAETPKVVIIGINKVGSDLIRLVHDIAKRCGIHRIQPASAETTSELIRKGEEKLNILLNDHAKIFTETKGDYWLTQLVCQSMCLLNDVTATVAQKRTLNFDQASLRAKVIAKLEHNFQEPVKEFCRGKRFRATNDPYLKVLRAISEQESSIVDLTELANANESVRGSINNIKESRLSVLLESKPICERYFYYNPASKLFAIEDPALFYYIKHLDWEAIKRACGFRIDGKEFDFDFAISFAGENRGLAKEIVNQLL